GRPLVRTLAPRGRRGGLHAGRLAISESGSGAAVKRLFETIAPRYADRHGGYLRIMKAGFRQGDNAAMAVIEFVDRDDSAKGAADRARSEAEAGEETAAA